MFFVTSSKLWLSIYIASQGEENIEKFDKLIAKMDEKNEPVNKNY